MARWLPNNRRNVLIHRHKLFYGHYNLLGLKRFPIRIIFFSNGATCFQVDVNWGTQVTMRENPLPTLLITSFATTIRETIMHIIHSKETVASRKLPQEEVDRGGGIAPETFRLRWHGFNRFTDASLGDGRKASPMAKLRTPTRLLTNGCRLELAKVEKQASTWGHDDCSHPSLELVLRD